MASQHETPAKRPTWKKTTPNLQWSHATPADLKLAIVAVTTNGGAIQFSTSRDGGTLILKAWCGLEEIKEYCTNPDEISSLLQWVASTQS